MLLKPSNNSPAQLPPELEKFRYLTEQQVSALTGRAIQSLRNDRHRKRGIVYCKWPGGMVRYKLADVLAAMERHRIDPEAAP